MSNSLAIAAVTATLQQMLNDSTTGVGANLPPNLPVGLNLNSISITTRPPDKARLPNDTSNQLNLFLYQTLPSAALRNQDMPRQVLPGETAQPPVALTLHYLLSAYASNDDDTAGHVLLGQAMRIFHDRAVLDPNDIRNALPGNDLYAQIERVRISPLPLSVEDISKLWTAFATNYRVSAGFEVSVVLIESSRPAKTPLPVLTRGQDDSGILAQANLTSPFPTLLEVRLPSSGQPSAQLGQSLVFRGHHLNGDSLTARFSHARLAVPIEIDLPVPSTDVQADIALALPDDAAARANWLAGFYTVALLVTRASDPVNKVRATNELAFSLSPNVLSVSPLTQPAATAFTLTLTASPLVGPEQRAALLFGNAEVIAAERTAATEPLSFAIEPEASALPGDTYIRLRVDGVDSLLVDYAQAPPKFFSNQKVTLT